MADQIPTPPPSDQITPGVPPEKGGPALDKIQKQIEEGKKLMGETPPPASKETIIPARPETVPTPEAQAPAPAAPPPTEVTPPPVSEPPLAVTEQQARVAEAQATEEKALDDLARAQEGVQESQETLEGAAVRAEDLAVKTATRVEAGKPMVTQPAAQTVIRAEKAATAASDMKEGVQDVKDQTAAVQKASRATVREIKNLSFEEQKATLEQGRQDAQTEK